MNISRREFLTYSIAAGAVLSSPISLRAESLLQSPQDIQSRRKSTVALLKSPNIRNKGGYDSTILKKMLDESMCLSQNEDNPEKAWKKIVSPSDVIGIKINCLGGRSIATTQELVNAVVESLIENKVAPGNIIIWERSDTDLKSGGYEVRKSPDEVRFTGVSKMDRETFTVAGIETKLSTFITSECSILINIPVLKTHAMAGFSGGLKNYMGAINNPVEFHSESCKSVGDLNSLEPIKNKTKLIIMDALRPLYDKGPGDSPHFRWEYNGIIVGSDPVAVDRVGMDILLAKRNEVKEQPWPLRLEPHYLKRAAELGVGQYESSLINVIENQV